MAYCPDCLNNQPTTSSPCQMRWGGMVTRLPEQSLVDLLSDGGFSKQKLFLPTN